MAPRGGNEKKESGRAKKADNANKKKEAEDNEREKKDADKWAQGSKGKSAKDEREEKRLAELKKKEEKAALLAAEEASMASVKPKASPKAGAKKKPVAPRPAGPGAIAAGGGIASALVKSESASTGTRTPVEEVESFSARGIDGALELMDVVTAKGDKESRSQAAAGLEKHPERRFKAAFAAYEERELPKLKEDHPGLRKNQYNELLYKNFKKSPDNPFNQASVAFDASKEEKLEVLKQKQEEVEERLRDRLRLDDA